MSVKAECERLKGEMFGAKKSENFAKEHIAELKKYSAAADILRGYEFQNTDGSSRKLPDIALIETKIGRLKNAVAERENEIKLNAAHIGELTAMRNVFEEYLHGKERAVERTSDERTSDEERE
jgi:hypothetical protein